MIKIKMNKVEDKGNIMGYANVVVELNEDSVISLRGIKVIKTSDGRLILRAPYNQYTRKSDDTDVRTPYFRTGVKINDAIISAFEKFLTEDEKFKDVNFELDMEGIDMKVYSLRLDDDKGGNLQAIFSIKFLDGEDLLFEMREIHEIKTKDGDILFIFPSYMKEKDGESIRYNIHFPMSQKTRDTLIEKMQES